MCFFCPTSARPVLGNLINFIKLINLIPPILIVLNRYSVYEVQNRNIFPLSPKDGALEAPLLQHVVWAPNNPTKAVTALPGGNGKHTSQAIAFVHENDLYYKPRVQNDLVCRITTTGIWNRISDPT